MSLAVTLEDVRDAARRIEGRVERTPCVHSRTLSEICGAEIHLKLENLQYTGSFKDRGALVKLLSLGEEQRRRGVIAVSAGNHAQGVAHHAHALGIPATIVMPQTTPFTKVAHTERHGATVVQAGDTLSGAMERAREIESERGLTFVHPYDDPLVVSGQGTVALEMLEEWPQLDALVVPVGGGGLISGMAVAAKGAKSRIEVIGAETSLYPSMYEALHDRPPSSGGQTIAEGIAVKTPGEITRAICAELVDDILLLDEASIEAAVQMLIEIEKTVAEGAGAAALAAVRANPERLRGRRVGLVVSGGNIDSRLLASVLMRGLVRDGRMVRLRIEIPDQPGALARVAQTIGDAGGNIVEIYHQRLFHDVPVKRADLDVVIETIDRGHVDEIREALRAAGFEAQLMASTASGGA